MVFVHDADDDSSPFGIKYLYKFREYATKNKVAVVIYSNRRNDTPEDAQWSIYLPTSGREA